MHHALAILLFTSRANLFSSKHASSWSLIVAKLNITVYKITVLTIKDFIYRIS